MVQARSGIRGSRGYVLGILLVVYGFNLIDRQIFSISFEQIKHEIVLSDTSLGLLSGFSFALFYAVLGVPLARLADSGDRRNLLSLCIGLWSLTTAVTGLSQNIWQLALARMGVGVGEAGCNPTAHSMISDLFARTERATAMAIYALGIPLGILAGLAAGGLLVQVWGWRIAMMLVGLPGMLLAVLVRLTVSEPVRGQADGLSSVGAVPGLFETIAVLYRSRAFVHLALGCAITTLVGGSITTWSPSYLIRVFGISIGQAGLCLGLIAGIPGGIGIFLGGWAADRLGRTNPSWRLWPVSFALLAQVPCAAIAYTANTKTAALGWLILPFALGNFFQATSFAQTQSLVAPRMRATAAAILFLMLNLIGTGLGPPLVGALSDWLSTRGDVRAIGDSLCIVSILNIWAALHYGFAGRYLPADLARSIARAGGAVWDS